MSFRKVTVLVSLFVVCFMLAAQSAKADDITFTDLTDTPALGTSGAPSRLILPSCSSVTETCTAFLQAPFLNLHAGAIINYALGEGSTTGNVSDSFHVIIHHSAWPLRHNVR